MEWWKTHLLRAHTGKEGKKRTLITDTAERKGG
jgi:hypothetical protein